MKRRKLNFNNLFADWQSATETERKTIEQCACTLYALGYWRLFDFSAFQEYLMGWKVYNASAIYHAHDKH